LNGSWTRQEEGTGYEETERVELLKVAKPKICFEEKVDVLKAFCSVSDPG
jgi:hypothetical protein